MTLQGHQFLVDLYILPIQGPEIVLGVQWLQQLGKVTHDYAKLSMEFKWNGKVISLTGDQMEHPKQISFNHLETLFISNEVFSCVELFHLSPVSPGNILKRAAAHVFL